jgi:hypothetical protein
MYLLSSAVDILIHLKFVTADVLTSCLEECQNVGLCKRYRGQIAVFNRAKVATFRNADMSVPCKKSCSMELR